MVMLTLVLQYKLASFKFVLSVVHLRLNRNFRGTLEK